MGSRIKLWNFFSSDLGNQKDITEITGRIVYNSVVKLVFYSITVDNLSLAQYLFS